MNDLSEIQYYTYCLGKLSCFFFFSYWQNDKTLSKPVFRVISVWLASSQIFIHDLTLNTSELHINYTCVQLSTVTYLFLFVNYYTCLVGYFNLKGDLREVICWCHFCSFFFFFFKVFKNTNKKNVQATFVKDPTRALQICNLKKGNEEETLCGSKIWFSAPEFSTLVASS